MINGNELNDEQLANVAGGSFNLDLTSIHQFNNAINFQNNAVLSPTLVIANAGRRGSSAQALGQGSTNNVGSTAVILNSSSI
jgi:hypothetical protein